MYFYSLKILKYTYYKTCFPSDLRYIINNPSNHPDNSSVISWFSDVAGMIFHLTCLSAKWAMTNTGNITKLFPWLLPLKWWSLGDWGSCPCGTLQACLHVSSTSPYRVIKPLLLLIAHPLNHWGWREQRRKGRKHMMSLGCVCPLVVC